MNVEQNRPIAGCADSCGTLPSCAPLAVPYVPFQQQGSKKYNRADALSNGTLFPGLNLPFHLKVEAVSLGNTPLTELQALQFVVHELGMYLDTHPDDKEAFALFQEYVALEREGKKRYEEMYGPLTLSTTANSDTFNWFKDPWPWDNMKEGAR